MKKRQSKLKSIITNLQRSPGAYFVEMAVQPVVNDGVKVLQAAPVECIEDVPFSPGLLKPGIHLIAVLQLKQKVGHGRGSPFILCQVTETGVLLR